MEGYDTRQNVKEYWTYSELLEMVYIEDLKAVEIHLEKKRLEEEEELEQMLKAGNG